MLNAIAKKSALKGQNRMYVLKRNGREQDVHFDKVSHRIGKLCNMKPQLDRNYVDSTQIAQKVISGIFPGVSTRELDRLAAETAAYNSSRHPDFDALAARIEVSNMHKETAQDFRVKFKQLRDYVCPKTLQPAPLIAEKPYLFFERNSEKLCSALLYERDYDRSFFGFKTWERSYALRCHGKIVERTQDMFLRVAIGIHHPEDPTNCSQAENDAAVDACIETYDLLSQGFFIHATPTLFNAATPAPQMSSCFLVQMKEDSIAGIYDTLKQCALISKSAGGIGVAVSNVRAANSYIRGTNGQSNGLVPMLRVFNDTARYVDQGGGKRKGAFAAYLEPWHADIFDFLELKKNHGNEEHRARDLFYGLWIPDLFMQRVANNEEWSLFCPNEAPGLHNVHSNEFEALYCRYEQEGKARAVISAQKLWHRIIESQIETGTPYMLYKDACNQKSNQQNLGCIKSSNLCTEIIEYTDPDEIAVCNLASLALPKFVNKETNTFEHEKLACVVAVAVRNLNKIIDRNFYPLPEARRSNLRHRPIGLGVQGLADVFLMLRMPFASDEAKKLNREIFETIYFAALSESCRLAEIIGKPYETFAGSPLSEGKLQFDLWNELPESERSGSARRWDWNALRMRIGLAGVRNSLLVAPMPTASTSQILGNNECIEPYTSNAYTRRVLAGEFMVINEHLVRDLIELNLWDEKMRNNIIKNRGSVQNIDEIPADLKALYKTVWEISQRDLIDMAADRGIYIDQSQSFNVHLPQPNYSQLTSLHFYAWKKGLKTGMYYLRSKAGADAIQFTVSSKSKQQQRKEKQTAGEVCTMQDGCISCGS